MHYAKHRKYNSLCFNSLVASVWADVSNISYMFPCLRVPLLKINSLNQPSRLSLVSPDSKSHLTGLFPRPSHLSNSNWHLSCPSTGRSTRLQSDSVFMRLPVQTTKYNQCLFLASPPPSLSLSDSFLLWSVIPPPHLLLFSLIPGWLYTIWQQCAVCSKQQVDDNLILLHNASVFLQKKSILTMYTTSQKFGLN